MRMRSLSAADAARHRRALIALLEDTVSGGASVGFLPPMPAGVAEAYWCEVEAGLEGGSRRLLAAFDGESLLGAVQVDLATKPNAGHRAEIVKLMVESRFRRRGLGKALMLAAEDAAREAGRTLLVLDTRQGDPSEHLYRSLGYTPAGAIPNYARSASGELHATVFFYKELGG